MKIQCSVCGAAEASILCCADEAALCWGCDQKLHAASEHQRVPLSNSPSQMPKCDICQETTGYFFCLEDRALLCRRCDVSIHTSNSLVSLHQRFLLTGVKVGVNTHNADLLSSSSSTTQYADFTFSDPPTPQWQLDQMIGYGDFTQIYNFMDIGDSIERGCEVDCLEKFWAVPQITSPPTAFGNR